MNANCLSRWLMMLGVFAAPLAPAVEPPVVGIVAIGTDPSPKIERWATFYDRMRVLGWRDGDTVRYAPRFAAGSKAKADAMLNELVAAKAAVIVVTGATEALAAQRATSSVPVVMLHVDDPVRLGLVRSLRHPGGNVTGLSSRAPGVARKQVELIAEVVPGTRRLAYGQGGTGSREHDAQFRAAAQALGLDYRVADLPRDRNFDAWAARMKHEEVDVAVFVLDRLTYGPRNSASLAEALTKHRLPAICPSGEYVVAGCLISYGPRNIDNYVRGAEIVDKILRGANPAELPVEQPTRFELAVNLRTAKKLGVTFPASILVRADRVIE